MMSFPSVLGQMLLLSTILFQLAASLPPRERDQAGEDLDGIVKSDVIRLNTQEVFGRNNVDALVGARLSQSRRPGLESRRQLGDIEFSNRYAEYLRSRAKHTSICAFLRRIQSVKKSGVEGNGERVNMLLNQYMCPNVLPWPSEL